MNDMPPSLRAAIGEAIFHIVKCDTTPFEISDFCGGTRIRYYKNGKVMFSLMLNKIFDKGYKIEYTDSLVMEYSNGY